MFQWSGLVGREFYYYYLSSQLYHIQDYFNMIDVKLIFESSLLFLLLTALCVCVCVQQDYRCVVRACHPFSMHSAFFLFIVDASVS